MLDNSQLFAEECLCRVKKCVHGTSSFGVILDFDAYTIAALLSLNKSEQMNLSFLKSKIDVDKSASEFTAAVRPRGRETRATNSHSQNMHTHDWDLTTSERRNDDEKHLVVL